MHVGTLPFLPVLFFDLKENKSYIQPICEYLRYRKTHSGTNLILSYMYNYKVIKPFRFGWFFEKAEIRQFGTIAFSYITRGTLIYIYIFFYYLCNTCRYFSLINDCESSHSLLYYNF